MSHIAKLNTITLKARQPMSPAEHRRAKLLHALTEQQALASAHMAGQEHRVMVHRWVRDTEGTKTRIERAKRLKAWWWQEGDGLCLVVRYGARPIELLKGKRAIRVEKKDQLPEVINTVMAAVQAGELDAAIEAVTGVRKLKISKS
jgi:hypothetical protein